MRTRTLLIPVAALGVTLAACGGDDDDAVADTTTANTTVADTAVETTTTAVDTTVPAATEPATTDAAATTEAPGTSGAASTPPSDAAPTPPGTQLTFGQPAVVVLDDEAPDQLIELTVRPLAQGTPEELTQLQVEDLAGGETLHYVTLDITNLSMPETGDYEPSMSSQLFLLLQDQTPATPVINFVVFEPCDEAAPDELAVGESFTTCFTYLAPAGSTPANVAFVESFDAEPILWS